MREKVIRLWIIVAGFNPCFSGIRSVREKVIRLWIIVAGFNPCFSGIRSVRKKSFILATY